MSLLLMTAQWLAGAPPLATLFVHPLKLPPGGRLFLFFPLALCIAIVYRVTRAERVGDLPWPSFKNFLGIVLARWALALAFFAAHQLAIRWV